MPPSAFRHNNKSSGIPIPIALPAIVAALLIGFVLSSRMPRPSVAVTSRDDDSIKQLKSEIEKLRGDNSTIQRRLNESEKDKQRLAEKIALLSPAEKPKTAREIRRRLEREKAIESMVKSIVGGFPEWQVELLKSLQIKAKRIADQLDRHYAGETVEIEDFTEDEVMLSKSAELKLSDTVREWQHYKNGE